MTPAAQPRSFPGSQLSQGSDRRRRRRRAGAPQTLAHVVYLPSSSWAGLADLASGAPPAREAAGQRTLTGNPGRQKGPVDGAGRGRFRTLPTLPRSRPSRAVRNATSARPASRGRRVLPAQRPPRLIAVGALLAALSARPAAAAAAGASDFALSELRFDGPDPAGGGLGPALLRRRFQMLPVAPPACPEFSPSSASDPAINVPTLKLSSELRGWMKKSD